jgi:hypothetical protein
MFAVNRQMNGKGGIFNRYCEVPIAQREDLRTVCVTNLDEWSFDLLALVGIQCLVHAHKYPNYNYYSLLVGILYIEPN